MAIGFRNKAKMVADTAKNVAVNALDVTTKTLAKLGGTIMDGINSEPTIRPVMDLSAIQNGVDSVNGLITNKSMQVAASANVTQSTQQSAMDNLGNSIISTIGSMLDANKSEFVEGSTVIEVPVVIDGREMARVTAPYTRAELIKMNKFQTKLGGVL
jgi:phage-related protein